MKKEKQKTKKQKKKKEKVNKKNKKRKKQKKMPKEKKSTIIAVVAAVVVLALLYIVFVRPMMMSGDARVLLVASDVLAQAGGKSKLESYLSSANVAVVPYNYDRVGTYAELGDLIKGHLDATGASRVRSVGIMYHTPNRYNLKCFASDPEKSTVSGSLESFEPFRRFVVALRGAYGVEDVDLVSCDVVSAESSVLSALDFNGARVNASTNTTGQVKQGPVGDWVLEAGNVNLIGRYFNEKIKTADLALTSQAQYQAWYQARKEAFLKKPGNRGWLPYKDSPWMNLDRINFDDRWELDGIAKWLRMVPRHNEASIPRQCRNFQGSKRCQRWTVTGNPREHEPDKCLYFIK